MLYPPAPVEDDDAAVSSRDILTRGPTGVDRIISHLGRTEAFLIVFLTCVVIYLPALGVPDLKGEEGRRILPAVASQLGKTLYRFTYRFQDDFQLVELLTETR